MNKLNMHIQDSLADNSSILLKKADIIVVKSLGKEYENSRLKAVCESEHLIKDHFSWCRPPYDSTQNSQYIQYSQTMFLEKKGLIMMVQHIETEEYLGEIGIDWIEESCNRLNIVYWIHPQHQNNGYASMSLKLLLKIASHLKLARYADIIMTTDNKSSRRVAQKTVSDHDNIVPQIIDLTGNSKQAYLFTYKL